MAESLSPAGRVKARRNYGIFNALNSVSFVLLSGSFITLFALRLGASNAFLGVLNALNYAAFFLLPLGKRLVKKSSIIGVYGKGWLGRYVSMLPVLLVPLCVGLGWLESALALLLIGTLGFNVSRGIGLIGNNPVLASLAEGRDRGAFLAQVSITANLSALASNLLVSLVLGRSASIGVYTFAIGFGLLVGALGTSFLFKVPEPEAYRPQAGSGIISSTREALREKPYRRFIAVFFTIAFSAGMARTFMPVYAKEAYELGDDLVMALSFISSLGAVAVGMLSRIALDRLGAKPLYLIYACLAAFGLIPAIVSPEWTSGAMLSLLAATFFVSTFGIGGAESAGQTYYFGLVPKEKTMDLAVAYFLVSGLGGTLGSTAGGFLLDAFNGWGLRPLASFRLFYGVVAFGFLAAAFGMRGLVRLGSASVRESLGALLSLRDLKAFDLMARLDRSMDPREELKLIHELGESGSPRAQKELVGHLSSPRFEIRTEALHALEALPDLEESSLAALLEEVRQRSSTTGYIAARILGKRGGGTALPVLREALRGSDPLLQGAAAVALARLGDRDSLEQVQVLLRTTSQPRVRIQAAYALEVYGSRASVPALVAAFRSEDPPAFVSDELVLALASILGVMDAFYPLYTAFSEDETRGLSHLRATAEEKLADAEGRSAFCRALESLFSEKAEGAPLARILMASDLDETASLVLADALFDPSLGYGGFRFFAAAYAVLGRPRPDEGLA